ncbi:MAG: hypothetical protein KAS86_00935 [Candidatus Omnitrophica bacterium]|nr:hypothetical protein [Candidatus Omnitrophota bacterium]
MDQVKTALLLIILTVMLICIGYVTGGPTGAVIAFFAALSLIHLAVIPRHAPLEEMVKRLRSMA